MKQYYKAVRPDGGSFNDPSFRWNTEPGGITTHPTGNRRGGRDATHYLSVATVPTDCTGMAWPCRLLLVEPVGRVWTPDIDRLPNKRAGLAFRTVEGLPATDALGPQGVELVALIERVRRITPKEARGLYAAWDAARDAAWYAAWYAARDAARDAAGNAAGSAAWSAAWYAAGSAAWYAAGSAAWALTLRDLIAPDKFTAADYALLTKPWREVIGKVHPADDE